MKYREHLEANIAPEYGPVPYLAYGDLCVIIRQLSSKAPPSVDQASRTISISAPPPTNARGLPGAGNLEMTEEAFFSKMDSELNKIEDFTLAEVTKLRRSIAAVEEELKAANLADKSTVEGIQSKTDRIAGDFLTLEKYVNLNFMGVHKILKKHDKYYPSNPCKSFYISRVHSQAWVRGDYSDVVVSLSSIYSTVRDDTAPEEARDASHSVVRSTSKYWVKTEDISKVKYAILRHLPVFLQKTSTGESDSQLTNCVHLDNDQLELYHNRLNKSKGGIALRLRWCGSGDPSFVFAERKTHRDKGNGESSVTERFVVPEKEVKDVLSGAYDIAAKKMAMLEKESSQGDVEGWAFLSREIIQMIQTKQLVPTIRCQYMRTAFQIPFDSAVRVSLDTNLCMISERGYSTQGGRVWHRGPSESIGHNQITRFPHAVLELKLELKGGKSVPPKWVTDLQNSGMLYEVHKFSKSIHGCATLLPDDVRSVPYWVDDISIRNSILASGGGQILATTDDGEEDKETSNDAGAGPGTSDRLIAFGDVSRTGESKAASAPAKQMPNQINVYNDFDEGVMDEYEDECFSWIFPFCSNRNSWEDSVVAPKSVQQMEPKLFFANERTYLHWLHQAVTLQTIASGILVFASRQEESWADWYALALLPISLGFCVYAIYVFLWRVDRIKTRVPGRWDDPRGPMILGGSLVLVLAINFCAKLSVISKYNALKYDL